MSSSPTRGNELGDLSVALGPKTSSPMLQGVLFLIFLHFIFSLQTINSLVFTQALKSKLKFTIIESLQFICTKKTHPCVNP